MGNFNQEKALVGAQRPRWGLLRDCEISFASLEDSRGSDGSQPISPSHQSDNCWAKRSLDSILAQYLVSIHTVGWRGQLEVFVEYDNSLTLSLTYHLTQTTPLMPSRYNSAVPC